MSIEHKRLSVGLKLIVNIVNTSKTYKTYLSDFFGYFAFCKGLSNDESEWIATNCLAIRNDGADDSAIFVIARRIVVARNNPRRHCEIRLRTLQMSIANFRGNLYLFLWIASNRLCDSRNDDRNRLPRFRHLPKSRNDKKGVERESANKIRPRNDDSAWIFLHSHKFKFYANFLYFFHE